ncbi:bile acid:sodium symporter family protein [Rhodococcus jostii]|uniref:Bile acid:Na+ symporter, BASS family n=1 Tax=Rhodococcus jostii TaxID=132919 RepID=A0A1H5M0F7_RHOJO|nr:bile acid:sodium symporter family protein [Rhodococcus jostii]SEE82855.1 bile acid:Na+ symporter, BASS family [Rhodococcus jostii]
MRYFHAASGVLTKYLSIWIICSAGLALLIPDQLAPIAAYAKYIIMLLMLMMGLTLSPQDFATIAKRPVSVVIGTVCHFTIMPLLALGIATALQLSSDLTIGLVLLGSIASGSASTVMVFIAKGDVALAVALGTLSTFLSIGLTPLLMKLLVGEMITISVASMARDIAQIVLVPIVLGLVIRYAFPKLVRGFMPLVGPISGVAIIVISGGVFAAGNAAFLASGPIIILAVILHNVGGFALGYLGSRATGRSFRETRAITLEVGMQNAGLASALANTYFSPAAALPSAIAGSWHVISGAILARFWASRTESEDRRTSTGVAADVREGTSGVLAQE